MSAVLKDPTTKHWKQPHGRGFHNDDLWAAKEYDHLTHGEPLHQSRCILGSSYDTNYRIEPTIRRVGGSIFLHQERVDRFFPTPHDSFFSQAIGRGAEWRRLLTDLTSWGQLPDDWDGEGGRAPTEASVNAGRDMLHRLAASAAPLPEAFVAGDGEFGYRWQLNGNFASASFIEDGNLLLYMHVGDEVLHSRDERWLPQTDISTFVADLAHFE